MRILFVLLLMTTAAHAESTGGAWFNFFPSLKLSDSLSLSSDVSLRQSGALDRNRQTLSRTALMFSLSPSVRAGAGYAYVDTTDYDLSLEPSNSENRIFEQVELSQPLETIALTHRLRFEQRFVEQNKSSNFWNRFRYRIAARTPKSSEPGLYGSFYNEFLFDFARGAWPTQSQNRLYGALGIPLNLERKIRAEVGYLWQSIRREPRESLHVHALQTSLFWDL